MSEAQHNASPERRYALDLYDVAALNLIAARLSRASDTLRGASRAGAVAGHELDAVRKVLRDELAALDALEVRR